MEGQLLLPTSLSSSALCEGCGPAGALFLETPDSPEERRGEGPRVNQRWPRAGPGRRGRGLHAQLMSSPGSFLSLRAAGDGHVELDILIFGTSQGVCWSLGGPPLPCGGPVISAWKPFGKEDWKHRDPR